MRPTNPLALTLGLGLVLGACAPAVAQTSSGGETALPPAAERLGLTQGRHRVSLFGGLQLGGLAHEEFINTAPITGSPQGSVPFHPQIDLESAPTYGLRYAYHFHDRWGIEASLSRTSSELDSTHGFVREDAEEVLAAWNPPDVPTGETPTQQREALLERLAARSGPYDIDVTNLEIGFVWIVNPRARWIFEAGGGLGWSWGSVDGEPLLFETLVHSQLHLPPVEIANTTPPLDPTGGEECPTDIDPCVSLAGGDGLTWHVGVGAAYAFTDTIQLRLLSRFRFVDAITEPGDSFIQPEATVGISFALGGR